MAREGGGDGLFYFGERGGEIFFNETRGQSDAANSHRLEDGLSLLVCDGARVMNVSVDFDCEPNRRTVEIEDETINRVLPAKLQA